MIRSFRSKALAHFGRTGDARKLSVQNVKRVADMLRTLDGAVGAQEMNIPGYRFHALKGRQTGRFAINASANWRITFAFDGRNAIDVDLEDLPLTSDNPLLRGLPPTHPGSILREEVLPGLRMPVSTAAKQLGVTRQTLHRILAEKAAVTPEMALRLGKFCGNGPGLWLRLQQSYDLWHAERALADVLKTIPTRKAA